MTPTLPERLKALGERATPGPWFAAHGEGDGGLTRVDDGKTAHDCLFPFECEAHDAELIVALRNALPELLSALEDQARYRWLRDVAPNATDWEFYIGVDSAAHINHWALTGSKADEAIDAAMADAARPTACATKEDGNG